MDQFEQDTPQKLDEMARKLSQEAARFCGSRIAQNKGGSESSNEIPVIRRKKSN